MKGINKALFVAAIAAAPELRYTNSGTAILELTLAGRSPVVTKEGDTKALAFYQRAKCFGKFAETLAERLTQGDAVAVEGRLDYRAWESEDKKTRSATEVVINTIETLDADAFTFAEDARGQPTLNEGVNEVLLAGNLTKDAESRVTPSGDTVANFSVAVNEGYGDKERPGFYRAEAWRELAETHASLPKGAGVIIKGRVNNDSFDGKDGRVFTTTVEATHLFASAGRREGRQAPPPVNDEAFQAKADLPF